MGQHCLTIPNRPKGWELISWYFLVIVLPFTTFDENSDY